MHITPNIFVLLYQRVNSEKENFFHLLLCLIVIRSLTCWVSMEESFLTLNDNLCVHSLLLFIVGVPVVSPEIRSLLCRALYTENGSSCSEKLAVQRGKTNVK